MTSQVGKIIAAAIVGSILGIGTASAAEVPSAAAAASQKALSQTFPGESYSQYGRRGYGGGYGRGGFRGGRYGYRGGYGRGRGFGGGGVAAGVIGGLAAGALLGGAIAGSQPAYGYGYAGPGAPVGNVYGYDPQGVEYCAQRYRSYDPASGTFLANDGYRYSCP